MDSPTEFELRYHDVHAAVVRACAKAGRSPSEIRMIGVTKTVDASALGPLMEAGVREFGENRWQHAKSLLDHPVSGDAIWHFIGHLQLNKVKYVVPRFSYVHSVDSKDLLQELERQAERFHTKMDALIQVNVSGEETKFGVTPDEAAPLAEVSRDLKRVRVVGLMTMAPAEASQDTIRDVFRGLAQLRKEISEHLGMEALTELSMGMSDDFELAIEEGATMIRVGRRLMGTSTL